MIAVPTFENCVTILKRARKELSGSLSAFELVDSTCLHMMRKAYSVQMPFASLHSQFYLLVETFQHGSGESAEEQLLSFLEAIGDLIEVSGHGVERELTFCLSGRRGGSR